MGRVVPITDLRQHDSDNDYDKVAVTVNRTRLRELRLQVVNGKILPADTVIEIIELLESVTATDSGLAEAIESLGYDPNKIK